ncbi:MAG: flagellar motor switch protein FliM [Rhodopirellula sp.]|nr:flagellar motor switch protein FliM [Rhodopirellula sp.]
MADVLSQSEVESLLAALEPGGGADSGKGQSDHTTRVSVYDFKRPERVSKEQMQAFQTLHEGFSRELGAALSAMLRNICEVKLISVDQLTYSEFVFSLEDPTCFILVDSKGLDGKIILDLNPCIVFPIVDRLLGGSRESRSDGPTQRPLTQIEVRLATRVTDLILQAMENAWSDICDLQLKVVQIESNPQLVQIVPPNEVVILISFEITLAESCGILNLCIPFNTIESKASKLTSTSWGSHEKRELNDAQKKNLNASLSLANVELNVLIAETKLSTSEVMNLEVGDIIMTEASAELGAAITISGRPIFRGVPGVYRGRKAIRITETLESPADAMGLEPKSHAQ